jgi:hypothetical protein
MSSNPDFDRLFAELQDISERRPGRWPGDPEWTDEAWQHRLVYLARGIYQAGARAQLYRGLRHDDPVDRLRWLAGLGLLAPDMTAVLDEVEDRREKAAALQGSYGVTDSDIRSMLAEGFHTAFRKAVDSPLATVIRKLIRDMEPGEYGAVIDFTAGPLIAMLREAEARAGEQEQETRS